MIDLNPITAHDSYLGVIMTLQETLDMELYVTTATREREIISLDIFRTTTNDITAARSLELMSQIDADVPQGGEDLKYGIKQAHHIRYWRVKNAKAPLVTSIHGGSWRSGTYMDSVGSLEVQHLINNGYVFASVDYTLIPNVTVEEQVQEVANAVGYMVKNVESLKFDFE